MITPHSPPKLLLHPWHSVATVLLLLGAGCGDTTGLCGLHLQQIANPTNPMFPHNGSADIAGVTEDACTTMQADTRVVERYSSWDPEGELDADPGIHTDTACPGRDDIEVSCASGCNATRTGIFCDQAVAIFEGTDDSEGSNSGGISGDNDFSNCSDVQTCPSGCNYRMVMFGNDRWMNILDATCEDGPRCMQPNAMLSGTTPEQECYRCDLYSGETICDNSQDSFYGCDFDFTCVE